LIQGSIRSYFISTNGSLDNAPWSCYWIMRCCGIIYLVYISVDRTPEAECAFVMLCISSRSYYCRHYAGAEKWPTGQSAKHLPRRFPAHTLRPASGSQGRALGDEVLAYLARVPVPAQIVLFGGLYLQQTCCTICHHESTRRHVLAR